MSASVCSRRMLVLHAHPDDESIMTGGVIARYLAEGVDVRVVTFTLGEEGEVIGDEYAHLVADQADQLGGYRIAELTRALAALSPAGGPVLTPRFLGGAGRWRDSGMAGTPSARNPRCLLQADHDVLAATLAAEIVEFAPQVVLTYDEAGTYGHPDHKRVHSVSRAALERAQAQTGARYKVYESVTEASALRAGLDSVTMIPEGWRMPDDGELPSYSDSRVTTEIDVSRYFEQKVSALAAHATQITVAPSRREYALSNDVLQPVFGCEHFLRVDEDVRGSRRETDLFAGVAE
ncbi:MAG: N-acetyl-1-D-myo-inositol-2-amino-2-deoxy-alpha-D-glucopyranoside deacetylase [Gordonia sp. (in: high G+C Gram-positive bacteria)]